MLKSPKRFLLICLASTAFAAPAFAENPEIVDVLLANIQRQTQTMPTFDAAMEDGDGNVTITNLKFAPQAAPEAAVSLTVGEIKLNDVSDAEDGLYTIASATFSNVKVEGKTTDGQTFTAEMPEGTAEEWYVKDAGENPTPADALRAAMTIAKKMSSGKITVNAMGQSFTSDGYESTWDGDPATGAGTSTFKVTNVVIPETVFALADPSNTLKNLGYSGMTLDLTGGGEYKVDQENMGLAMNFGIAAKDMATLKFAVNADKIPLAAYAELQKAQTSGKEPDFNALMPQLQSVTFGGFSFRFEDASITKKVLPMIAAISGMGDEAALVANAGAMAQVGLMQFNNPEFSQQVVGAINTFLKDPKSFTVALKPDAPVSVQQIMTLNPADPGAAIKTLGINVTAND